MECEIMQDLLPLYLDDCCTPASRRAVEAHLKHCPACAARLDAMEAELPEVTESMPQPSRVRQWQASLLQSVLLFASFGLIALGVALEAATPAGADNGWWAWTLIVPATGFFLSLANWYFVRLYTSRGQFCLSSGGLTLCLTLGGFGWTWWHYGAWQWNPLCIMLTVFFCGLSALLSGCYGRLLGKE